MINVLEFSNLHEYKYAWNLSARVCYHVFENLDRCQILYRYKLSDSFIWQKFGAVEPSKINFDKIYGSSLFIFHLDVYKKSTEDISKLLDFCLEKNIDVYIPIRNKMAPIMEGYDYSHINKIIEVLNNYETTRYDFTNFYGKLGEIENFIIEETKPLIRDIKMRKIFN